MENNYLTGGSHNISPRKEFLLGGIEHLNVKPASIKHHFPGQKNLHSQLRSSIGRKHKRSRSHVPRSLSGNENIASTRTSMDISRMRRSVSNLYVPATSTTQPNLIDNILQISSEPPFLYPGGIPPQPYFEPQRGSSEILGCRPSNEYDLNSHSFLPLNIPLEPIIPPHNSEYDHKRTNLEDPADFIDRNHDDSDPSSISISSPSITDFGQISTSSLSTPGPPTPNTGSFTPRTSTISTSLGDNFSNNLLESLVLIKLNSSNYHQTDEYTHKNYSFASPQYSMEEQSMHPGGSDVISLNHHLPLTMISSTYPQVPESSPSTESPLTRSYKRLHESNNIACSRPLRPKGTDQGFSHRGSSIPLVDRKNEVNKVSLPKSSYQRPKHKRVLCNMCHKYPKGFRGEHELRRHKNREHEPLVKRFICIQPTEGQNHPQPILPLSKCKSCSQRKFYNTYYNAVEHLRRAHFNPKSRGRSKNKLDNDRIKFGSGGKICEGWPPMKELKCYWVETIEETAAEIPIENTENVENFKDEIQKMSSEESTSMHLPPPSLNHLYPTLADIGSNNKEILSTHDENSINFNSDLVNADFNFGNPDSQNTYLDSSCDIYTLNSSNIPFIASTTFPDPLYFFSDPNLNLQNMNTNLVLNNFNHLGILCPSHNPSSF